VADVPSGRLANRSPWEARRGIWNIENLEFTPLLRDKAYEFAFVWAPLKIVGGTGSPGNPMALY
jgi:kynurenine formamidase